MKLIVLFTFFTMVEVKHFVSKDLSLTEKYLYTYEGQSYIRTGPDLTVDKYVSLRRMATFTSLIESFISTYENWCLELPDMFHNYELQVTKRGTKPFKQAKASCDSESPFPNLLSLPRKAKWKELQQQLYKEERQRPMGHDFCRGQLKFWAPYMLTKSKEGEWLIRNIYTNKLVTGIWEISQNETACTSNVCETYIRIGQEPIVLYNSTKMLHIDHTEWELPTVYTNEPNLLCAYKPEWKALTYCDTTHMTKEASFIRSKYDKCTTNVKLMKSEYNEVKENLQNLLQAHDLSLPNLDREGRELLESMKAFQVDENFDLILPEEEYKIKRTRRASLNGPMVQYMILSRHSDDPYAAWKRYLRLSSEYSGSINGSFSKHYVLPGFEIDESEGSDDILRQHMNMSTPLLGFTREKVLMLDRFEIMYRILEYGKGKGITSLLVQLHYLIHNYGEVMHKRTTKGQIAYNRRALEMLRRSLDASREDVSKIANIQNDILEVAKRMHKKFQLDVYLSTIEEVLQTLYNLGTTYMRKLERSNNQLSQMIMISKLHRTSHFLREDIMDLNREQESMYFSCNFPSKVFTEQGELIVRFYGIRKTDTKYQIYEITPIPFLENNVLQMYKQDERQYVATTTTADGVTTQISLPQHDVQNCLDKAICSLHRLTPITTCEQKSVTQRMQSCTLLQLPTNYTFVRKLPKHLVYITRTASVKSDCNPSSYLTHDNRVFDYSNCTLRIGETDYGGIRFRPDSEKIEDDSELVLMEEFSSLLNMMDKYQNTAALNNGTEDDNSVNVIHFTTTVKPFDPKNITIPELQEEVIEQGFLSWLITKIDILSIDLGIKWELLTQGMLLPLILTALAILIIGCCIWRKGCCNPFSCCRKSTPQQATVHHIATNPTTEGNDSSILKFSRNFCGRKERTNSIPLDSV